MRDTRAEDAKRRKLGAAVFALLAVVAAVTPFLAGAHAIWIAVGVGTGVVLLVVSLTIATDSDLNGPPPQRIG
ncbi:hypothetical protein [Haloprofundus sp. MHR1]|uniref:hypothetical protein n=1 Tax=Haloprofundus sp. MHR1 TaxID=2572921 RepID=UPI0010BE9E40|nr:hypothetical protein [Haloprofundus sp. MHR1]QCJ48014.1 hypothetical protein FCF25_13190 [Haloprofundus sp. MHR1]